MADKKNNKNTFTAIQKRRVIKVMCNEYHKKFNKQSPRKKQDLNYSEVKTLLDSNDSTSKLLKDLFMADKIDPRDALSRYRLDVLEEFSKHFKGNNEEEDSEDLQLELSSLYEEWFLKDNPTSKKRITPSTIKVSQILTFLATSSSKALPNLFSFGVNDFSTWRVKDMKLEALKACREHLVKSA